MERGQKSPAAIKNLGTLQKDSLCVRVLFNGSLFQKQIAYFQERLITLTRTISDYQS